ncbi:formate dehydrogenase beta subunit [Microvirga puerhi]|uniref:NADH-quinone oxidoreductase subunit NuoF n=1 Tax=Microvirga puerhi TaxID=2876078 RepID=A0ABS7VTC7_9HYPH|nr:NADH-quinone oxidoreductase subunit NuoF [Microvirga puerhi]MBZ6078391.1 NADH-quinone oxidoreductase subunit NuoF [Microvirga puerhi]
MMRVFLSQDAASLALGAGRIGHMLSDEATRRGIVLDLVRTGSRGLFWLEPLVEIETPEGRIAYGPLSPADIPSLFEAGFLQGAPHARRIGRMEEHSYLARQRRLTFARCGIVDPLSLQDYRAHDGFKALECALRLAPAAVVDEVRESGLRGRGGAGFPTAIKWDTVLHRDAGQKYVVCNADEGDSGTFADRMLMEGDPFCLIEGMLIAGLAVGATKGFIYIRSEYLHAFRVMSRAIEIATEAGYLGPSVLGSGRSFELETRLGAGAYICGEETSLLESLEGKRGVVRAKPPVPAIEGLFGKPTVVNNALSFAVIPWILAHGAKAYADYGMGRSRGTMPVQLAGNVRQGGLIELGFGVTLRELVYDFGGGTMTGRSVKAVQVGGPLGAYFPESMLDLPFDYETLAAAKGMLGHGGIVVFDDTVDLAQQARFAFEFCAAESCGKCTPCRIGAVRGVEVLDRIIAGVERERNFALLDDLCQLMTDASLCAMGGLTPVPVRSGLAHFPDDFDKAPPLRAAAE